jgi:hypothetical protein
MISVHLKRIDKVMEISDPTHNSSLTASMKKRDPYLLLDIQKCYKSACLDTF